MSQRLADAEDLLLVDIRTPAEIEQGMIPDALRLPMHLIPVRMSELPKDRDVVLYCRSGARSYQACAYMMQQGYGRVLNLRGGIIAWARHGYPIAAPDA
nr:rhd_2599 family sulfurtransferase [Thiocystis violacea]